MVPTARTNGSSRTKCRRTPDTENLISAMLDYEAAARESGVDFASGRFKKLSVRKRQSVHAELVAEYIRLSAAMSGVDRCEEEAEAFCSTVCELEMPSHEMLGTYLAALRVVSKDKRLKAIPLLNKALIDAFPRVLRICVSRMKSRSAKPLQAAA